MSRSTRSAGAYASTASLVLIALCFGLGQNIIKPIIAPQAVALGGDAFDAGIVVAAQGIGGLLVAIPIGGLMARVGGRLIVGCGAVVFIIGAVVMVVATTPLALAAGHFLFGAGGVGAWLAAQTMCTVAEDDDSARRKIARVTTAALVGLLAGPPLGGLLTDLVDVRLAFGASLVTGVLLLPVVLALPRLRREATPDPADVPPRASFTASTSSLLTRPGLVAVLLTSCLAQALQTIRQSFLPLHLQDAGWSATEIGGALSVAGVGALFARTAFTQLDRRLSVAALILLCLLPGALTLGTAVWFDAVVVVLVSVLVSGFALGLAQPVTLLALARVTSHRERGPAVGLRVAGNRLMQAVSPLFFGFVATWLGLLPAFSAVALVSSLCGVWVAVRGRQGGRSAAR